ncbi:MAG TPA: hypothetical protein VEL07_19185 [Planctomycetota bacterium]|nr:hypothetical protein [Planctomycetota bacterium]
MELEDPKTAMRNTCCPVCGTGTTASSPVVDLRPADKRHGLVVSIRVDSPECAEAALRDPDKHVFAAEINQVAH